MQISIFNPSGTEKANVTIEKGSRLYQSLMQEDYVQLNFNLSSPVTFLRGDYIRIALNAPENWWQRQDDTFYLLDSNGNNLIDSESFRLIYSKNTSSEPVRYYVTDRTTPTYDTNTGAWKYTLRLDAWYYSWKRYILRLAPQYGASTTSFGYTNTFIEHIRIFLIHLAHAAKTDPTIQLPLQINVQYINEDANGIHHATRSTYTFDATLSTITLQESTTSTTAIDPYSSDASKLVQDTVRYIHYDAKTTTDAMNDICAEGCYNTEWWFTGSVLNFGRCETGTPITIQNDVHAILSRSDSSGEYATRLIAYGGTTNVPARYRKKLILTVTDPTAPAVDTTRPLIASYFTSDTHTRKSGGGSASNTLTDQQIANATLIQSFSIDPSQNCVLSFKSANLVFTRTYTNENEWFAFDELIHNGNILIKFYDQNGDIITDKTITVRPTAYSNERPGTGATTKSTLFFDSETKFSTPPSAAMCLVVLDGITASPLLNGATINYYITVEYTNYLISAYARILTGTHEGQNIKVTVNQAFADPKSQQSASFTGLSELERGETFVLVKSQTSTIDNDCIIIDDVPVSYLTDDFSASDDNKTLVASFERRLMLPASDCPNGYIQTDMATAEPAQTVETVHVFDDIYPTIDLKVARVEWFKQTIKNEYYGETETTYPTDFYIYIRRSDLDFSTKYIVPDMDLQLQFTTGRLAGLTFGLKFKGNTTLTDAAGRQLQRYQIIPTTDNGIRLPNPLLCPTGETTVSYTNQADTTSDIGETITTTLTAAQQPDHITLINYNAKAITSLGLVDDAERRLLIQAKAYLDKISNDDGTYTARMFHTFFKDLQTMPTLGQTATLVDAGIFTTPRSTRIIGCDIPLDVEIDAPTYTLGESPRYSRLSAIESRQS